MYCKYNADPMNHGKSQSDIYSKHESKHFTLRSLSLECRPPEPTVLVSEVWCDLVDESLSSFRLQVELAACHPFHLLLESRLVDDLL